MSSRERPCTSTWRADASIAGCGAPVRVRQSGRTGFEGKFTRRIFQELMEFGVGSIVDGKVTGITKFGAFVALPEGRSGLVHISRSLIPM